MRSTRGRGNRTGWALIRNCSGRYLHLAYFFQGGVVHKLYVFMCSKTRQYIALIIHEAEPSLTDQLGVE